ncbi:MAG: AGE family epimerase/isomerase [Lachnospiraceae bacterium]|nr:AGE family epimerase/isomerase [Lachnospiraceae bacterium]
MFREEIERELKEHIIPFWKGMRDDEYGGYYGYMGFDLRLDKKAVKGCILNSRILWFFSNAYMLLKDEELLSEAKHAYEFMTEHCLDRKYGGIYWSLNYDGSVFDSTKHTYNQAFAIYALSSYYNASGDEKALTEAEALMKTVEEKCTDDIGYLEAFKEDFSPESNEKLSENGVMAEKTMNTLLHVLEAYTELYRVSRNELAKKRLMFMLDIIETKIYNSGLKRQEVFFDRNYNSLIDLHSYGHDIETAWLLDRTLEIIGDPGYSERLGRVTRALSERIYERAYTGDSLLNECEKGKDNTVRIWWVQAETVVGFVNAYEKSGDEKYLKAAENVWNYIKEYQIDKREGSEWFYAVDENRRPDPEKPIVEEWKCPYHNGRMCMEIMKRL